MLKPSEEQTHIALEAAERMWEHDLDPHHLARTLRYLHSRNKSLEQLLVNADRYIRFGMAEQHMKYLKNSVDKLREEEERNEGDSEMGSSIML